jgi:hypothetical protein
MDRMYPSQPSLSAVFDAARRFGLTEQEGWRVFDAVLAQVGTDVTVEEYLEELTGKLAQGILGKHRGVLSEGQRVASGDRL